MTDSFNEEISNSRLATKLKKYINSQGNLKNQLPNLYYCGRKVIHAVGSEPAVFLLANEKDEVRVFGNATCRSAWACPTCTAKVMAQKGTDIACMIDLQAKWYNKNAFMLTFTLPHTANMSCSDTYEIIRKTWRHFIRSGNGNKSKREYVLKKDHTGKEEKGKYKNIIGKAGEVRTYYNGNDPYGNFRTELDIKLTLKVWEFTWGENSWHPHIHALFWTDAKNFKDDSITKHIKILNERWWQCAKYCTEKLFGKEFMENLYTDWRKEHPGITLSTDKNGLPRVQCSSHYITGWSGDTELTKGTSNFKQAKSGHLTPFQIIAKTETDPENWQKWMNLYIEYALATKNSRRVEWSKGHGIFIRDLINKWKRTNDYIELVKKKVSDKAHEWRMVYWFSEKQWSEICWLNVTTPQQVITEILIRAVNKQALEEYLQELEIPLTTRKHNREEHIVNNIFENRILAA